MKKLLFFFFIIFCTEVNAESYGTGGQFLDFFLNQSKLDCDQIKSMIADYEKQGNSEKADSLKGQREQFCECIPEQIQKIRHEESRESLSKVFSEGELTKKYKPPLIDRCAARVAIYPYKYECEKRFKKVKTNSKKYCSCMNSYISSTDESELAKIGVEADDYFSQINISKKAGLQAPEQPLALKKYMETEKSCSAD